MYGMTGFGNPPCHCNDAHACPAEFGARGPRQVLSAIDWCDSHQSVLSELLALLSGQGLDCFELKPTAGVYPCASLYSLTNQHIQRC